MSRPVDLRHPHGRWHPGPDIIDADVDLHDPQQEAEVRPHEWDVLAAVGVGGVLGAESRYALGVLWPDAATSFPWTTLWVNVLGCLGLGVLMVVLFEFLDTPPRLLRPLLGTGVLGGFTTFSTFSLDVERLVRSGHAGVAAAYLAASVLGCLLAVAVATAATRAVAQLLPERAGAA
jgi:fluoride exporter